MSRLQRKGLEEKHGGSSGSHPSPLPFWGGLALQKGGQGSQIGARGVTDSIFVFFSEECSWEGDEPLGRWGL